MSEPRTHPASERGQEIQTHAFYIKVGHKGASADFRFAALHPRIHCLSRPSLANPFPYLVITREYRARRYALRIHRTRAVPSSDLVQRHLASSECCKQCELPSICPTTAQRPSSSAQTQYLSNNNHPPTGGPQPVQPGLPHNGGPAPTRMAPAGAAVPPGSRGGVPSPRPVPGRHGTCWHQHNLHWLRQGLVLCRRHRAVHGVPAVLHDPRRQLHLKRQLR